MKQQLKIDLGFKEYSINGDENAVIRINTTDMGIVDRIFKSEKEIKKIVKNYEIQESKGISADKKIHLLSDCEKEIRKQINYIFNSDVCTTVFGEMNCLSICGGRPVFMNFLDAILPVIKKDVKAEQEKLSKAKINKYTSKVKK